MSWLFKKQAYVGTVFLFLFTSSLLLSLIFLLFLLVYGTMNLRPAETLLPQLGC